MSFKIAFIGAGSLGFTRRLVADILTVPEFRNIRISFTDINSKNLEMVAKRCQKDINSNGLKIKIEQTTNRRQALKDAKYVVNVVRIGGLEGFATDVDIPLKYGVDQCVGDTLCAGGIMYGQRGIAAILDFCKDIREVCAPDCLLLNYANPNAMMTWAANMYGKVRTLGLCHGVQGGHWMISQVIELLVNKDKGAKKGKKGYETVTAKDVDIICAGINHQTWYISIKYKGKDWTGRMLEGFELHPEFSKTEKVRIDMIKRFGYFSTESNGHLSEYVAWYRKRENEIKDWIDMSSWINGETGGYLRVCTEGRNWIETDLPKWMNEPAMKYTAKDRSVEHGSHIIESLETGRTYRGHFNIVNNGCITNLPDDAIIEVPCYSDRNGISIPKVGDLPLGCAAVCNSSISVQRLSVEAAASGNDTLLRQAMMMDPLVGAVCNPPEIWQMTDEMLVAGAKWLPQYKSAIAEARKRLSKGNLIPTRSGYKGAARLEVKVSAKK